MAKWRAIHQNANAIAINWLHAKEIFLDEILSPGTVYNSCYWFIFPFDYTRGNCEGSCNSDLIKLLTIIAHGWEWQYLIAWITFMLWKWKIPIKHLSEQFRSKFPNQAKRIGISFVNLLLIGLESFCWCRSLSYSELFTSRIITSPIISVVTFPGCKLTN